jgi:hypothetical protein
MFSRCLLYYRPSGPRKRGGEVGRSGIGMEERDRDGNGIQEAEEENGLG